MKKLLVFVFAMVFCASVGIATADEKAATPAQPKAEEKAAPKGQAKAQAKGQDKAPKDQAKGAAK
jgi:hypothetical protein